MRIEYNDVLPISRSKLKIIMFTVGNIISEPNKT